MSSLYSLRITKNDFYFRGGLSNPKLFRKQSKSGGWKYYYKE